MRIFASIVRRYSYSEVSMGSDLSGCDRHTIGEPMVWRSGILVPFSGVLA